RGYLEEAYFSFSYSPIPDEAGDVAGVFCPVIETTDKIIGERRLRTLRDLATATKGAATEQEVFDAIGRVLSGNLRDVPFSVVYRVNPAGEEATLAASAGFESGAQRAPAIVPLNGPGDAGWSLASVVRSGKPAVIAEPQTFAGLPTGAWAVPPTNAVVK